MSQAHFTLSKYRNWLFIFILSLGGVWIITSRTSPGDASSSMDAQPFEGFPAPDFEFQTTDNSSLRLSDLRGQPVIMNFWASWCPPCRAEMPAIQAVSQSYNEEGLIVLAVNATNQDSIDEAQEFIEGSGFTFQILFDTTGTVQAQYQVVALPTTFFIDRDGIIQAVIIGGPMAQALIDIHAQQILLEKP
jgi:cytochrome c biogenesis protein CcmG/thiol:disulfide interchange protein DsbE